MSITTRDLKLRQKEVEKNLNETYSTLRKQPEGGLGAMIQKPNHNEPPIKRTPVLFTPSPMLSSLPYLAEWVKVRSNENAINMTAHLIRQRETAKASIIYDDMKQNEIDIRNDKVLETVSRNFAPSTAELLRKYLSDEIDKTRDGERKIQEERMKRVDLAMNPVRPEAPAVAPPLLRTLTAGDMGRPNVPDQAEIRKLRNQYYDRQREVEENKIRAGEVGRQASIVAGEAKDQAVKRKFSNMAEGLVAKQNEKALDMVKQLRKFKEDEKAVEDTKMEKAIAFNKKKTFEKAVASMKAEKFYDTSMSKVKEPQIQMLRDLNATLPGNPYYNQGAFTTPKEEVARAVALATLRGQLPASATENLKVGNIRRQLAKGVI
jgi:hypothetical protein